MNFYLGNSVEEINVTDNNVEFSEELLDFIYRRNRISDFDMSCLCDIDPYGDVEIPKEDVFKILDICVYVLKSMFIHTYEDVEQATQMLYDLIEISQKAIESNKGLISIGD